MKQKNVSNRKIQCDILKTSLELKCIKKRNRKQKTYNEGSMEDLQKKDKGHKTHMQDDLGKEYERKKGFKNIFVQKY